MTGRPRPHAITNTDLFLGRVLDELEGLRGDLRGYVARTFPEPTAPAPAKEGPSEGDRATVRIEEPAPTPPARPVKKAMPRKATRPKDTR